MNTEKLLKLLLIDEDPADEAAVLTFILNKGHRDCYRFIEKSLADQCSCTLLALQLT